MTVTVIGPLEHLVGKRYRSKSLPVMEGELQGIGSGYFIVLTNCCRCYTTTKVEVTPEKLERRWEPIE